MAAAADRTGREPQAAPALSRPKKALFSLLTLALALVVIEVGVRAWLGLRDEAPLVRRHPVAGYAARPKLDRFSKRCRDRVIHYSTTAEGFRITAEAAADELRPHVVLLGDSYVFGWCADDRDTLGYQLAERLGAPVVSLAYNGYGTDVQLVLLRDHLERVGPANVRAVVVLSTSNDVTDVLAARRLGRAKPYFVQAGSGFAERPAVWSWRDYLLDESWLANAVLVPAVIHPVIPSSVPADQAAVLVCHLLGRIGTLCAEAGIPLARLFFPIPRPRREPSIGPAELLAACAAADVSLEDISPLVITAEAPLEQLVAADGHHWNRAGNARVARLIAERLARVEPPGRRHPGPVRR